MTDTPLEGERRTAMGGPLGPETTPMSWLITGTRLARMIRPDSSSGHDLGLRLS
jgi:hypothetical protein